MNRIDAKASVFAIVVCIVGLITSSIHGDDRICQFWQQFVANASQPVDGHFIVDIKSDSNTEQGPKRLRTSIEYWVRGDDLRFDIKDHEGRDLNSQVVLKNAGQTVLDNSDRTNASIVVSQSERSSKMAESQRATWLYFQTLLGRYPFSPLALYQESFQDLKTLCETKRVVSVMEGQERVITFTHNNGRSMSFRFRGAERNPHTITNLRSDGSVAKRLNTVWEPMTSHRNDLIAKSGVFEALGSTGIVHERCEWTHSLAEDLPSGSDPFTWEAMALAVGKKMIITDSTKRNSTGGYWNGNKFSSTPIATQSPRQSSTLLWLSLVGLGLGIVLFVLKLRVYLKGSKR